MNWEAIKILFTSSFFFFFFCRYYAVNHACKDVIIMALLSLDESVKKENFSLAQISWKIYLCSLLWLLFSLEGSALCLKKKFSVKNQSRLLKSLCCRLLRHSKAIIFIWNCFHGVKQFIGENFPFCAEKEKNK